MKSRKTYLPQAMAVLTLLSSTLLTAQAQDEPAKADINTNLFFLEIGTVQSNPVPKEVTLGVHVTPANSPLTSQLQLPAGVGLLVEHVGKGSPAEKAGVQVNDVLHKLDDQLLVNTDQLRTLVSIRKAKEEVTLTVFRGGKSTEVKCVLAAYAATKPAAEKFDAFLYFHGQPGKTRMQNCSLCHEGHADAKKHPKGEFDNFDFFHGKPGFRYYQDCSRCHQQSVKPLKGVSKTVPATDLEIHMLKEFQQDGELPRDIEVRWADRVLLKGTDSSFLELYTTPEWKPVAPNSKKQSEKKTP